MKIISLLPSATEIICALGLENSIYGITHECDYPESIKDRKKILSTTVDFDKLNNGQINKIIRDTNSSADIYKLDIEEIIKIAPDYIITQDLCQSCSINIDQINNAISHLEKKPEIISMSPKSIEDINQSIIKISEKFKVAEKGLELVDYMNSEIRKILSITKNIHHKPKVFCMDWMNPIFSAGHWITEMVNIAGGESINLNNEKKSKEIAFSELVNYAPNFIFIMPCGYDIERTTNEINILLENPDLNKIPAFNMGQVYIVNANSYFSKPSYRIIEGIKIIARTINNQTYKYEPEPDAILNLQNYMHFESFSG